MKLGVIFNIKIEYLEISIFLKLFYFYIYLLSSLKDFLKTFTATIDDLNYLSAVYF